MTGISPAASPGSSISYALDAAAGSTRLVNSVELDPSQPRLRLLAPLATPKIKAPVAQNLGKLKLVLESGRPAKDFCRGKRHRHRQGQLHQISK